jgi:enoyl-CoA hydratase/carnithine racemase
MASAEPLLYELHDRARDAGLDGYRRMTKAALVEALDGVEAGPTTVESSVRVGLGLITLRGGGQNALAIETLEGLADAAEATAADASVRLVAITGAGTHIFSSGADLKALQGLTGEQIAGRGGAALDRIAALEVPTLALLNGHVVGGGIDLALACDWRIAVEGAKLRFIHNELGFSPPWGAAGRLAALVPPGIALRLFATCELVSSQEARTLGIVDEVVAPHKLLSRAESLAVRIGRSDRQALAATKRLLQPGVEPGEHARTFAALWDAKPATLQS